MKLPTTVAEAQAHMKSRGLVRLALYSYCQMAFRWMGQEYRMKNG